MRTGFKSQHGSFIDRASDSLLQSISWGPAIGITGDKIRYQTNGTYVDAYIPDALSFLRALRRTA